MLFRSQQIDVSRAPGSRDIAGIVLRSRPKRESFAAVGAQDHGQQLQESTFSGAALANERNLGAGRNHEFRYLEAKLRAARLVALYDIAQMKDRIAQGSASSSSG